MKKVMASFAALFAICMMANAGSASKTEVVNNFSGLEVNGNFKVDLIHGASSKVEFRVDERVIDYCRAEVKGSVLKIYLDEKSFPKELKADLRKKNNSISIIEADVTIAGNSLNSIALNDNAVLNAIPFESSGEVQISLDNNSSFLSLELKASSLKVNTQKKAKLEGTVSVNKVDASIKGNSNVYLKLSCSNAKIETAGSSISEVEGNINKVELKSSASSNFTGSGNWNELEIQGKDGADINVHSASLKNVKVALSGMGVKCSVAPANSLSIEMQNGAKLTFDGKPEINIVKIVNSSVTPYSESKSKGKK